MSQEQARLRFTNRMIYTFYPNFPQAIRALAGIGIMNRALGALDLNPRQIAKKVQNEFTSLLSMLEELNRLLEGFGGQAKLSKSIESEIANADEDLGVRWRGGKFYLAGARILDDKLVNDPLDWLRSRGLSTVHEPFEKSLRHLFESRKDKSLLEDAVTNAYNALEAMAKVVCGNDKLFPANRERFIDALVHVSGSL